MITPKYQHVLLRQLRRDLAEVPTPTLQLIAAAVRCAFDTAGQERETEMARLRLQEVLNHYLSEV